MSEKLKLSVLLPATPEQIFKAWLDSNAHGEFTGDTAKIDPRVGGKFTAWGGYIRGRTLELEPGKRILQAWRTTEFPEDAPDSTLEILLEAEGKGSRITLIHTDIPDGQAKQYEQGWEEYYFTPMKEYFTK